MDFLKKMLDANILLPTGILITFIPQWLDIPSLNAPAYIIGFGLLIFNLYWLTIVRKKKS
tara:strand:- start:772 stop:951 length:180 start_codon:yes stop_codon:yes gene_type:complete